MSHSNHSFGSIRKLLLDSLSNSPPEAEAPDSPEGTPSSKINLSSYVRALQPPDIFWELPATPMGHIALDNVSPLGEVVHLLYPCSHQYEACWLQYDSAGGLCLLSQGRHLNTLPKFQTSVPCVIQGLNSTTDTQLEVV